MRLGSGPTHSPLLTGPEKGWGGGEVALALPASGFHAERLHTDSILSLYRLALRDGQGLAQGHTANG